MQRATMFTPIQFSCQLITKQGLILSECGEKEKKTQVGVSGVSHCLHIILYLAHRP